MRVGEPELDAAGLTCLVQVGQEFGAGEIDSRNRAEEKDDQPHRSWRALNSSSTRSRTNSTLK